MRRRLPTKRPRGRPPGSLNKSGKSTLVVEKLFRKNGATREELVEITGWSFSPTYLRRLAEVRDAELIEIKKGRWRFQRAD